MKCPACGTRNNFYHRYCYFCGEKLGAMIDPPDQDDRSPGQEDTSAGDAAFSAYDDHDTISEKTASSIGYEDKEDYSRESYFTQENESVDIPEDFFGYPAGDTSAPPGVSGIDDTVDTDEDPSDDIDYFGYPSTREADPGLDSREDTAAGTAPQDDYTGSQPDHSAGTVSEYGEDLDFSGTTGPAGDPLSSIEKDIAAKISYMEKYMDAYLSGGVMPEQDGTPGEREKDDTPAYNDSLDFIQIEEEEPVPPKPDPEQRPASGPVQRYEPRPAPPAAPPPPPVPTDEDADTDIDRDESDPYEDEETSKMIDILYQGKPSSPDSSYPRRSHRHAPVKDTEETEEPPDNADGNIVVKIMISLVIIGLMGFAGFVLYNEFFNPNNVPAESSMDLLVTHTLDRDTLQDGTSGQRLTIYAPGAASAALFGENYPVENDKVQQFYSDDFLLQQYQAAGDAAENNEFTAIATVYDADGKFIAHDVDFTLSDAAVQLAVFSPEGDTVEVQGNTCTLEISVQPGALLYVNDTDYSNQVGPDGLAVIDIDVSGTEEMSVHIRASLDGYADAERTITLIPVQETPGESLLTLNESIPVATTSTDVVLTGQVPPGATIETSLPQSVSPAITDNGAFSVTVQIPSRPGYSVCLMRVMLDGTQVDQQEIVIDKTATFNEYTTGPVELSPYEDYKSDPSLHAGYRFQVPGTVREIISQRDGLTICTVDTNPDGTEHLIRVWFWGDFSYTAGSSVKVYGNRWGNEEGVPRILAKYIITQ